MNIAQEIKYNMILKKLSYAEKELKELLHDAQPLNSAEEDNIESALTLVKKAINCL